MGWNSLFLLGFLLSGARMQPLVDDISDTEVISDFFVDLFVEDARGGRNLENNEIEQIEMKDQSIEGENTKSNTEEVASYNTYMDAVFRRMNAALKAKLMDPMELNLNKKEKTNKDKKDKKEKNDGKKRVDRDVSDIEGEEEAATEDLEVDVEDSVDRMGTAQKKKVKKEKKNDKNKPKKGVSKNKKAGDKKNKNKKGGKKEQDPKVKAQKKAEREKKRQQKREMKKREKEARKTGKLSRDKRNKQSKEETEDKKKDTKDKKNKKEKITKNKGRNDKKPKEDGKAIGSLSGIATMRRFGDVTVEEEETHRLVTSVFTVGPLQLEVSRSFGQGQDRTVKTAKAATDVMTGVMVIKVKPDGSAHVKKVVFKKPEHVNVQGSISDKKARSKKILMNSLNKSRPLAAQKILQTARFILKSPSKTRNS